MAVEFLFDENMLGVAKIVCRLREDSTHPGDPGLVTKRFRRPACPIAAGTRDPQLLRVVSARGWAIITKDKGIRRKPRERDLVIAHKAILFCVVGSGGRNLTVWEQLEIVVLHWRDMARARMKGGPAIYRMTRTAFTRTL